MNIHTDVLYEEVNLINIVYETSLCWITKLQIPVFIFKNKEEVVGRCGYEESCNILDNFVKNIVNNIKPLYDIMERR